MAEQSQRWRIEEYSTPKGEKPILSFFLGLEGQNKTEAMGLIRLLEERGKHAAIPAVENGRDGPVRIAWAPGTGVLHLPCGQAGRKSRWGDQEKRRDCRRGALAG